jgi:enoyl-CoA hydratase/carnithine racemase
MTDHVRHEQSNGVLTLTLNRPEKKNALTRAMYQALGDAILGAGDDPDARCIVIQGEGDAFTAGNDLGDFAAINQSAPSGGSAERHTNPLLQALGRTMTPVVAAVQGRAVGIGTTMLLHCDLVFLAEDALLTTPFVNLALVPEAASSLLLPARIGHARAFSMFVLGEAVNAATALS